MNPATALPPEWEVMPEGSSPGRDDLQAIAKRCRQRVGRRALFAAGVAMVPVPGLDWLTDIGLLMKLLP